MSNTHLLQDPFTVVADACTRQLKYADSSLMTGISGSGSRGATTLEVVNDPNSSYRFNYIVHVNKRRLGTLGVSHFKSVIDRELVSFRYDNPTLYRAHVADMKQFLSDFALTPANVTSLEIAVDTNRPVYDEFLACFLNPDLYNYHYSPTTLEKLRVAGELYRDGSQQFTLLPHIAADKLLKVYDKTRDIAAKGKRYITEYHKNNGLDIAQRIDRVELTLFNTALKTKELEYVKGDQHLTPYYYKLLGEREKRGFEEREIITDLTPTVEEMTDPVKLLSLFYKYTNKFRAFSYKSQGGTVRPTRCQTVPLLNLGVPAAPVGIEYYADPKQYKIQMTATYKTLLRLYYTGNDATYLRTAEKLAKDTNTAAELEKQKQALAPLRTLYATAAPGGLYLPI